MISCGVDLRPPMVSAGSRRRLGADGAATLVSSVRRECFSTLPPPISVTLVLTRRERGEGAEPLCRRERDVPDKPPDWAWVRMADQEAAPVAPPLLRCRVVAGAEREVPVLVVPLAAAAALPAAGRGERPAGNAASHLMRAALGVWLAAARELVTHKRHTRH